MSAPRVLRTLVVDDEGPARAKATRLLARDPRFETIGEAGDGLEALARIEAQRPDLVLLDVRMPGLGGFDVLDAIGRDRSFAVIFSTAFDRHALRAFEEHAVDYLLKPYDEERFGRALDKAWTILRGARDDASRRIAWASLRTPDRVVLRSGLGWVALDVGRITRARASGKHVELTVDGKEVLVRQPLIALLDRLGAERFLRVHRSDAVRLDAVVKLEPLTHGDALLTLCDGGSVVLSRTYREEFLRRWSGPNGAAY